MAKECNVFFLTYDSIQTLGKKINILEEFTVGRNMLTTFPVKQIPWGKFLDPEISQVS